MESNSTNTYFDWLPTEILEHILSYLNPVEQMKMVKLSPLWKNLVQQKTRERSRSLFVDALQDARSSLLKSSPIDNLQTDKSVEVENDIKLIAFKIEQALFNVSGGDVDRKYTTKFRSLLANIKNEKNKELRTSLIQHEIDPAKLVTMTATDMAGEELNQLRKEYEHRASLKRKLESQQLVIGRDPIRYVTAPFGCEHCGCKEIGYYEWRTTEDNGTTIMFCTNCSHRWEG